MNAVKLIFSILIFFPLSVHAYLDPGAGNALLAALFGIAGSVIFFSKNIYYKIKGIVTGKKDTQAVRAKLAIFSEGKIYWQYFKDIIDQLIKMKVPFTYYTLDIDDPALDLFDYGNPNADFDAFKIKYVGSGNKGYAAIGALKEPYILSTTPNIGTTGYPIKKSKSCKNLIHIYHSVAGAANYKKHSLDCYDTVIQSGEAFNKDIRELERKRGLPQKKLLIGGLPYIDNLVKRAAQLDQNTNGKTVLIASTWNKRGVLRTYGSKFIIDIAKDGYDVIVRPHPYSFVFEPDFIETLKNELKNYDNVKFDDEIDNLKSLARADILVSDVSSVRLDYFFAFNRPSISLETPDELKDEYEYGDLESFWSLDISKSIGVYVKKEEIGQIKEKIKELSKVNMVNKESIVANIGNSAEIIAEQISKLITEDK
ncbi:MAG: CDP-glycerol glycerophosphotransferase family protein [Elusimicrobiota bacterium]|jgi:hypothetical protein|nr:CDP-glycerol glycerophosphotransferase family protein [Elusimicrobiota bacterium]